MRNIWILLIVGVAASFLSERIFISAQSPSSSSTDDLYLEDQQSGDYSDDEDFSGSGSGDSSHFEVVEEKVISRTVDVAPKAEPTQEVPAETTPTPSLPATTSTYPVTTKWELPEGDDVTDLVSTNTGTSPGPSTSSSTSSSDAFDSTDSVVRTLDEDNNYLMEVHTENLLERTEVLAAVIAGGVIGFLFAIFLILLLVYRMRKKDEGSYDLGERKPPPTAYQSAPTREFYA